MKTRDFDYSLPPELIAQFPVKERSGSRLLFLDKATDQTSHQTFSDLPELLNPNDLLIFNDTRVIPARLYGVKETGGQVEILVERVLDEQKVLAHVRASKAPKVGMVLNCHPRDTSCSHPRDTSRSHSRESGNLTEHSERHPERSEGSFSESGSDSRFRGNDNINN